MGFVPARQTERHAAGFARSWAFAHVTRGVLFFYARKLEIEGRGR
jgi:hypothetical protein